MFIIWRDRKKIQVKFYLEINNMTGNSNINEKEFERKLKKFKEKRRFQSEENQYENLIDENEDNYEEKQ